VLQRVTSSRAYNIRFEGRHLVIIISLEMLAAFSLVDFPVSPQIRDDREMASAAFHITCECCKRSVKKFGMIDLAALTLLAGVAIHMGLQRARPRKALVTDLALVLLLRARRDPRAELGHH
jgi:hypothetical protein